MLKKINEKITSSDDILFELETHDSNGLLADPDVIEKVSVHFIQHCSNRAGKKAYALKQYNPELERDYKVLQSNTTKNPNSDNIKKLKEIKSLLEATAITQQIQYQDAIQVFNLGSIDNPAFPGEVKKLSTGKFNLTWSAEGQCEGKYFITWSWFKNGEQKWTHFSFQIEPSNLEGRTDPSRTTSKSKYETLMSLYMPNMYQYRMKEADITPQVLKKLNACVATAFTEIENRANHIIDMLDPNGVNEVLLPLLANLFNVKLRSNDVTLWRRQIGQAIPLFKKKGTLSAIKEALDQAGINLTKVTRLWQVVSEYIWVDGFPIVADTDDVYVTTTDSYMPVTIGSKIGHLSRLPFDTKQIEVKLKSSGSFEHITVPSDCIQIIDTLTKTEMPMVIWLGGLQNPPIHLYHGDTIILSYHLKPIPQERKPLEDYIQELPLLDSRDPHSQKYPLKNWNVKALEEDDPLFDLIVSSRHPFVDPIVWGKIRTAFAYSENTYNMDTYDGSLRDSKEPCDIDKNFLDTCNACQSTAYNIDVEVNELSDEKFIEILEIIREYTPFHAILHSININGITRDFISPQQMIQSSVEHTGSSTPKGAEVKDYISQTDSINYEIEWSDGTKEKGTVN